MQLSPQQQKDVEALRRFVSDSRWAIGRMAHEVAGPDEVAMLVGLTVEQLQLSRLIWARFGKIREEFQDLFWDHFRMARSWEDWRECLFWANENQATPNEMAAWRRAMHGADLSEPAEWSDGQ